MKKIFALILALTMILSLAACGSTASTDVAAEPVADEEIVYAVEAGSAGEEVALANGYTVNSVETQADALMEVSAGTSDAAIIDLLMAVAMTGEGTSYPDLKYTDSLSSEEYGIGCRKGSDLASYINQCLYEAQEDGTLKEVAAKYNLVDAMIDMPEAAFVESDGDVAYIQGKGTLIVGITDFAPMDYKDDNDEWIGFDADMAKVVAEKLGVTCEFIEIEWDNKVLELEAKSIDVVWNGMTLTDGVKEAMEASNPYFNNAQVIVVAD